MNDAQSVGVNKKRYSGEYIGKVVSIDDPDEYMRVQVRAFDVFEGVPDADLPWATYKLPIGSRANDGNFTPVDVGDFVWVDFPFECDTRWPRITGSVHYCPSGVPNFPHEAWSGPDKYSHKRTGSQLTPTDTGYHRDVVFSQHGVLVEIVSETGEFRVTQKSSGSAVEIDRAGNVTAHSENNLYGSSVNNTEVEVGVDLKANVGNDATVDVTKNATLTVGVTASVTAGTLIAIQAPLISLTGNLTTIGGGGGSCTEDKKALTTHEGSYTLDGPLVVNGTITSSGNITAPYLDGVAREANDN